MEHVYKPCPLTLAPVQVNAPVEPSARPPGSPNGHASRTHLAHPLAISASCLPPTANRSQLRTGPHETPSDSDSPACTHSTATSTTCRSSLKGHPSTCRDTSSRSFSTRAMEDTLLSSLRLRIGFPYVLQHAGQCEHVAICSDARLLHPLDAQTARHYPLRTGSAQRKRLLCRICNRLTSRYRLPTPPVPSPFGHPLSCPTLPLPCPSSLPLPFTSHRTSFIRPFLSLNET